MPDVSEIKSLVEDIGQNVQGLRDEVNQQKDRIDQIETAGSRPGYGDGAAEQTDKAVEEFAAIARNERKDLTAGHGPSGGYVLSPASQTALLNGLTTTSAIRRLARRLTVNSGSVEVPVEASAAVAHFVSETQDRPVSTPSFGKITIPTFEVAAEVRATQSLLEDAGVDLGRWIQDMLVRSFGKVENAALVGGSGVERPQGILAVPTSQDSDPADGSARTTVQTIPSGATDSIDPDAVIDLAYSLSAQYLAGAVFVCNRRTMGHLRKLKDLQGRYLWEPDTRAGQPGTLLGLPVALDDQMPDPAVGAYPLAIGNWQRAYLIADRLSISIQRDDMSQAPFTRFLGRRRLGGSVLDYSAYKLMVMAAS